MDEQTRTPRFLQSRNTCVHTHDVTSSAWGCLAQLCTPVPQQDPQQLGVGCEEQVSTLPRGFAADGRRDGAGIGLAPIVVNVIKREHKQSILPWRNTAK